MSAAKGNEQERLHQEMVLKKLGERIKAIRLSRGSTNYEKFAFEHDIARSQLSKFEKGGDLLFSSLLKVLNALDISLAEFFAEGFDENKS